MAASYCRLKSALAPFDPPYTAVFAWQDRQRREENGISYKGAHWYAVKQYIPKHRIHGDVVKVRFSVPYRLNEY